MKSLKKSVTESHWSSEEESGDLNFDFQSFCASMKNSINEDVSESQDVDLGYYLSAYEQLYNFFQLLGGAFQFVAQDVKSKMKILRTYMREEGENSDNFSTVKKMITYEIEKKLLQNSKYVSGSRTLLRLHRGLDFIRKFLKDLYETEDNMRLGSIAREIYDQTLADYHSWVVRNSARVAMQFLPTRIDLLHKISQNDEERQADILEAFPEALETTNIVYDRVQCMFSDNDLLDLP